jgi:quercetin dioxygenase-like cupin family protein
MYKLKAPSIMDKAMPYRTLLTLLPIAVLFAAPNRARADDSGIRETPLLSTATTAMGEALHYPTAGPARVTAAIATLAPGARTVLHRHGVPLFAYVLDGEITVDYGDRGKRTYRQGDAVMETMDVPHFGTNTGAQPVRLLIVFMGAEGAANVIPEQ